MTNQSKTWSNQIGREIEQSRCKPPFIALVVSLPIEPTNGNDGRGEPGMNHKWESGESVQWSQMRGGRAEDAATPFQCKQCGVRFVHRYNIQPDICIAMKKGVIRDERAWAVLCL